MLEQNKESNMDVIDRKQWLRCKDMEAKYPEIHMDHATGIVSRTESEPFLKKRPFKVFKAYMPETDEEILLLITSGNWSYHARHDEPVDRVIRSAIKAMKAQKKYNNNYRWWQIPSIMIFLASWKPVFSREIAISAGNCTAGTDKWFSDHGYAQKDFVTWWQMFKHLFESRSRMVAWYLWDQQRSPIK